DFRDNFGRFSIIFRGVIYRKSILPPEKESKIGQNNPENRRTLNPLAASYPAKELRPLESALFLYTYNNALFNRRERLSSIE
ncbi:MAG: hypothetical protein Q8L98_03860, partial [Chlamydiales bacterium]|nr:hypothetical protein [Chlamydiales bacterium]